MRAAGQSLHAASGQLRAEHQAGIGRQVAVWVALLVGLLVVLFPQSALAAEPTRSYLSSFGPDGTAATGFEAVSSIAVDKETGVVYVLDSVAGVLYKFDADGSPLAFGGSAPYITDNRIEGLSPYSGRDESQVAVDSTSHVIYVTEKNSVKAFQADGEPFVFTEGPGAGTNELPGEVVLGVTVDTSGFVYVSEYQPARITVYGSTGALITQFESTEGSANVAVDSVANVYVNRYLNPISRITASAFPAPSTTYSNPQLFTSNTSFGVAVDPTTDEVFAPEEPFDSEPRVGQYAKDGTLVLTIGETGPGKLYAPSGIAVNGDSSRVYAGDSAIAGAAQVRIFGPEVFPQLPPTIESLSAVGVTSDLAELRARINPNTLDTTYYFEFGLEDCSATPNPCTVLSPADPDIGFGHDGVWVSRQLTDLQAGTTYHYRVVAENSLGVTKSTDRTFTTQASDLGFQLSDSRVWEMVSPPNKHGGVLELQASGIVQAAEGGDGLAFQSLGSIDAAPEGNRAVEASTVLAGRGADGWHSRDITPPHTEVTGLEFPEYKVFTPDLSRALFDARDDTPLSPLTSERSPYLRENTEPPVYTPLLTTKEGYANVPPGTEFDRVGLDLMGANARLTDIVFVSNAPLETGAEENSLYRWSAGQVTPVSELPADEGGGVVVGKLGSAEGSVRHAVSDDGSRVFWGPGSPGYGNAGIDFPALYLRDTEREETVRLDEVQPGATGEGPAHPAFQGANAAGTVVFFTDSQRLTEDASSEGRDLYRCEVPAGATEDGCASLTAISAPPMGSGESAGVKDLVSALSDDGTRLYFVAEGVLDSAPNLQGESATLGEPNLYFWQQGQGVRYIATVSKRDMTTWGGLPSRDIGYAGTISAAASPSGRYYAFMSERSLTGYDNRDAASGELNEEAFRYDAVTGALTCVSCNPSGASPQGRKMPDLTPTKVDAQVAWPNRWVAAILPQARVEGFGDTFYRPRAVVDNGRVFFNAIDSLVAGDSNGDWDVYQYEPTGVGSCTASTTGTAASRSGDGCVGLISSGTAEEEAVFLDASASGDDAFFLSSAQLSSLDTDTVYDVYDARVNGVQARLPSNPECLGEACQPAPQAPIDPTPASSTFSGPGNAKGHCPKGKRAVKRKGKTRCVARCPKGKRAIKRKGKSRCVARKHRVHKPRSHKAAGREGRGR